MVNVKLNKEVRVSFSVVLSASIAQWLQRPPSNPTVMRSSPGRGRTYMCLPCWGQSASWQLKAMPGTNFLCPQLWKSGGAYWFRLVHMYVRTYVCIHVRDIVLKLHVWIPHGKIADAYFWFSLNYLPLSNYGPLTNKGMKFCKCHISKSIIARNLKLVSADRGW